MPFENMHGFISFLIKQMNERNAYVDPNSIGTDLFITVMILSFRTDRSEQTV